MQQNQVFIHVLIHRPSNLIQYQVDVTGFTGLSLGIQPNSIAIDSFSINVLVLRIAAPHVTNLAHPLYGTMPVLMSISPDAGLDTSGGAERA